MRLMTGLVATLLSIAPAPAVPQNIPDMTLAPGEAVTVRVGADGRSTPPERHRAQWSAFDIYAARHLTGITPPDAPVTVGTPFYSGPGEPTPAPVPAGQVRLRFLSIAGRHSLLVVENGLQRAIAYRARMTVGGETRPTDVCIVLAGLPSYEHWPHPIERLDLTGFRHVPSQPGQPPTCE